MFSASSHVRQYTDLCIQLAASLVHFGGIVRGFGYTSHAYCAVDRSGWGTMFNNFYFSSLAWTYGPTIVFLLTGSQCWRTETATATDTQQTGGLPITIRAILVQVVEFEAKKSIYTGFNIQYSCVPNVNRRELSLRLTIVCTWFWNVTSSEFITNVIAWYKRYMIVLEEYWEGFSMR